jgi:hypothetical protein
VYFPEKEGIDGQGMWHVCAYGTFMGRTDGKRRTRKVQAFMGDNIKMGFQDKISMT